MTVNNTRIRAKTFVILLAILAFAFSEGLQAESDVSAASASDNDEWVYYGFCPSVNFTVPAIIGERWIIKNYTWLTVVGYNDSTRVTVYDIADVSSRVLQSFTVDRMKAIAMKLSSVEANFSVETFFKVVADKPVAVLMSGGFDYVGRGMANVFYPSTDGGFAGKEFIIMAASAADIHARKGWDYAVFAIEDSTVVVHDGDDKVIRTVNVAANSSKRLELYMERIYRIRSTGRILVSSWAGSSYTICPGHMGGYSGTLFFANPYQSGISGSPILVIATQDSPAQIKVYDISTGSLVAEKSLHSGEVWFINRDVADLEGVQLRVESSEKAIVYSGATIKKEGVPDSPALIANAVMFLTAWADRSTTVFSPTEAYVFSPNGAAEVYIDGLRVTVPRGSYKAIPSGLITIATNETVVVETVSRQPGISHFATYLLPANRLGVTYPPPQPREAEPTGGLDIDTMLVVAVAGGAAILATIFILKKRS